VFETKVTSLSAIGPQGSGTRALSLELIKRTGMERQIGELLALGPSEAAEKLKAGEIDVAFMMTSWGAPVVQQLLAWPLFAEDVALC
jgi:TRAP-type uncharacterized transport system substrate-binding protein